MIIDAKHKLSIERYRAPYRGVTSKYDFVNFYLGVTHDLKYGENHIGLDENFRGLIQKESDNFKVIFTGENATPTTSLASAGKYVHIADDILIDKDLRNWQIQNEGEIKKFSNKESYNFSSKGLKDPVFISKTINLYPGEIAYIRFKIKKIKGNADSIYIGTDNINGTGEDLKKINLKNESSAIFVDKRLYSNERQSVLLKIYLHKIPQKLEPTEITIEDLSIQYMTEKDISVGGIENEIKPSLDNLEEKISYMKKRKGGL